MVKHHSDIVLLISGTNFLKHLDVPQMLLLLNQGSKLSCFVRPMKCDEGCQWLELQILLSVYYLLFTCLILFYQSILLILSCTTSGSGWVDFTCLYTFLSFYPFILLFCSLFSCYVKHIELHLCMKCAIQIKLPCLALSRLPNKNGKMFKRESNTEIALPVNWIYSTSCGSLILVRFTKSQCKAFCQAPWGPNTNVCTRQHPMLALTTVVAPIPWLAVLVALLGPDWMKLSSEICFKKAKERNTRANICIHRSKKRMKK